MTPNKQPVERVHSSESLPFASSNGAHRNSSGRPDRRLGSNQSLSVLTRELEGILEESALASSKPDLEQPLTASIQNTQAEEQFRESSDWATMMKATAAAIADLCGQIADLRADLAEERAARLRQNRKQGDVVKGTPEPGVETLRLISSAMIELLQRTATVGAVVVTPAQDELDYYSPEQFSEKVGKRPYTVREWCRLGRIHCTKNPVSDKWEIPKSELDRYTRHKLLSAKK